MEELSCWGIIPTLSTQTRLSDISFLISTIVNLDVYAMNGRHIATLVHEVQNSGLKNVTWSGINNQGISVSGGVYFYRLWVDDFTRTGKMLFLK